MLLRVITHDKSAHEEMTPKILHVSLQLLLLVLCIVRSMNDFSTSGIAHYQQFEDLLTILRTLEEREKTLYGKAAVLMHTYIYMLWAVWCCKCKTLTCNTCGYIYKPVNVRVLFSKILQFFCKSLVTSE